MKVKYLHKGRILVDERQEFRFLVETPDGQTIVETRANTEDQALATVERLRDESGAGIITKIIRRAA